MTSPRSILVVGAGLAGARCAETLRAEGYDGELVLVGEEPFAPYERPALSKEFLSGDKSASDLLPAARLVLAGAADRARARSARRRGRSGAKNRDHERGPRDRLGRARPGDRSTGAATSIRHAFGRARAPDACRRARASARAPARGAPCDRGRRIRRRRGRVDRPQARSRRDAARGGLGAVRAGSGARARRQARSALPRPGRRSPHRNGRGRVPGSSGRTGAGGRARRRQCRRVRRRPRCCGCRARTRARRRGRRRRSSPAATTRARGDTGPARPPRPWARPGAFSSSTRSRSSHRSSGPTSSACVCSSSATRRTRTRSSSKARNESFIARYRARGGRLVAALASNQPAAMGGLRLEVAAAA